MGDGPAYDYAYDRAAQLRSRKREQQKKRAELLHGVLFAVGFGENDGDLTEIEREAARHLRLAYDLFTLVQR